MGVQDLETSLRPEWLEAKQPLKKKGYRPRDTGIRHTPWREIGELAPQVPLSTSQMQVIVVRPRSAELNISSRSKRQNGGDVRKRTQNWRPNQRSHRHKT